MPQTHLGNPLPADVDFFVAAPSEIGDVLSQSSTLKQGQQGTASKAHIQLALAFFGIAVICGLVYWKTNNTFALVGALLFAGFGGLRAINIKRFECNYVGELGFARYRVGKDDQTKNSIEGGIFLYKNGAHLYTNVIETRGLCPFYGQNAVYQWVDANNKFLVSIFTDQYVPTDPVPDDSVISFLRAAEAQWVRTRLPIAQGTLASGRAEFPNRRGGVVALTADRIVFETKEKMEIMGSDLVAINHVSGDLEFVTGAGKVAALNVSFFADAMLFEELVAAQFGLERYDSGIRRA
ncbi:MAG: hypothetical protein WCK51_07930 [Armatimonadota bacterium]